MKSLGFTLIETIIYCALFGVLMSGAIVTVYALLNSNERTKEQTSIVAESVFINSKLKWLFMGATAVVLIDTQTLEITRPDLGTSSPVTLNIVDEAWRLTRSSNPSQVLSAPHLKVTNAMFLVATDTVVVTYDINNESFMFSGNY